MMAQELLCVVPQPKRVAWGRGAFVLSPHTSILLLPTAGEAEHFAARSLQKEIRKATGLSLPIVKVARPAAQDDYLLLVSDLDAARTFGVALPSWARDLAGHGEQAYVVEVTPGRVLAGGESALALHYAVQTLRQMVRAGGNTWPALHIVDWPSLPYRGVMLDVSRGKVPTMETLKQIVDQLSLYKANVLQLYTEHTFVFPHHPRIGLDCGSLSSDDILELDAYARPRQVQLMPNLQSFGHCAHILNLPEYAHLAECAARWSLCPTDEATYAFLDDLYADLLPAFSSKMFNVGCDETWDLGKGRSAAAVAAQGTGRAYLQHILRLHGLAARYGCRIQLWGDILLHYPELVSELPDDVTLLDWHYEAEDDYPSVRIFSQSGRPYWVCPGTSSWNTLFPRIENSNANIRTLARVGSENGATGLLTTDWGDDGHYQPLGQCWYGYICGAEQAWSGGTTDGNAFDARFGRLFFGVDGAAVVAAMRQLGKLNVLPGMPLPNATRSIYMLLDEPLLAEASLQVPESTLAEIKRVCDHAERTFYAAVATSRDPLSLAEMAYSTRMMRHAARKALASQRVHADLAALAAGQGDAATSLRQSIETFRALETKLLELTEVFRDLWLQRARHSEISITLGHFARLAERYRAAQVWLEERLAQFQAGESPSYEMSSYAEAARSYEILGQGFWRQMHEAGVTLD